MPKPVASVVLHLVATGANVREVEPNGQVLSHVRFVGKQFDTATNSFEPVSGGVEVSVGLKLDRRLGHLLDALRKGDLLAGDQATAKFAGVSFQGAK